MIPAPVTVHRSSSRVTAQTFDEFYLFYYGHFLDLRVFKDGY